MTARILRGTLVPLALTLFAACGRKDDTAASRQVELAPAPTSQPQLADTARPAEKVASTEPAKPAPKETKITKPVSKPTPAPAAAPSVAPAPVASAPAPAPEPTKPATGVVAGGSSIAASVGSRVCTNTHKVGDNITASVSQDIAGTNGAIIPAGATVTLRVTSSTRGENGKEGVALGVAPVSVSFNGNTYAIDGTASLAHVEPVRVQTSGDQAKKVATGAVVGAIAGQILGKRAKSAAVGAAVGAAAGGVVAAGSADWDGCAASGSAVTVHLTGPVTVKVR